MIPLFLFSPSSIIEQQRREKEFAKQEAKRRIPLCVPYTPNVKWQPELNFTADSWKPLLLFPDVPPTTAANPNQSTSPGLVSPKGEWLYTVKRLPAGERLYTYYGKKKGTVLFDKEILIPAVHIDERGRWSRNPFMSYTPMETLSLRGGTKRAKGEVIVAGLGLGYQLIEVSKRVGKVTKLTLVEKSQDLVDWLYPQVKPHLQMPVDVIVGDAYQVLPKLNADVALVDIFDGYGSNNFEQRQLREACFGIDYIWCWGAAEIA